MKLPKVVSDSGQGCVSDRGVDAFVVVKVEIVKRRFLDVVVVEKSERAYTSLVEERAYLPWLKYCILPHNFSTREGRKRFLRPNQRFTAFVRGHLSLLSGVFVLFWVEPEKVRSTSQKLMTTNVS